MKIKNQNEKMKIEASPLAIKSKKSGVVWETKTGEK
jgi:hypothetical protein